MYTEKHLVEFGNYVLSNYRKNLIDTHPELTLPDKEAAYSNVSDADLANWNALGLHLLNWDEVPLIVE